MVPPLDAAALAPLLVLAAASVVLLIAIAFRRSLRLASSLALGRPRQLAGIFRAAWASVTGVWLLASGPAAAAHGALASSEPAGGSSLERAPAAVTLRFTERPDPGLSSVRVLDSRGRVVAGGPQPLSQRQQ